MQVIGFAGVARVGKSYSTNALKEVAEQQGWKVFIVPFAKPLKDAAEQKGFAKDTNPEEYRKFCQDHGAEMRAADPDHWLNKWYSLVRTIQKEEAADDSGCPYLIISDDVRYENELNAIRKNNGLAVYLHPGDRVLEGAGEAWRTHESEMLANTVLGNHEMYAHMFDFFVKNNGEVKALMGWALRFFKDIINFPGDLRDRCDCEGCNAALENRPVDTDKVNQELDDLLNDIDKKVNGDDEDDNPEDA